MSRYTLEPLEEGQPVPESRRLSPTHPNLYLMSMAGDVCRLACSRCGADLPVQVRSLKDLQRAVMDMELRHNPVVTAGQTRCGLIGEAVGFHPWRRPARGAGKGLRPLFEVIDGTR